MFQKLSLIKKISFSMATILLLLSGRVVSDVVRDLTIGPDNINVQPIQTTTAHGIVNFEIPESQGQRSGNNVFHSFSEFDIHIGQSATFTGSNSINNVISRITDVDASLIDGKISSGIDAANIYLINQRGFLFGSNASIDVTGAFHLSTSESLGFSDGERAFETHRGGYVPPVLSTASPTDFGLLGTNSGDIVFDGARILITRDIAVHARKIELKDNARISSIIMGDGQNGVISLNATDSITLNNAIIEGRREIAVHAPNIELKNNAGISSFILGDGKSGVITLHATENITLNDAKIVGKKDINLTAKNIDLSNNGRIRTITANTNEGGDINLVATERISLSDYTTRADGFRNAVLLTEANGESRIDIPNQDDRIAGKGGDIKLTAPVVEITNGAQVKVFTGEASDSDSGNITISASESFTLSGSHPDVGVSNSDSWLIVSTGKRSTGKGGTISITAGLVEVSGGARIITNTFGAGDAGDINLTAIGNITIEDPTNGPEHVIDTDTEKFASGNAGNINLSAAQISILNGADISSRTRGAGNGGDISIRASESITLEGASDPGGTINSTASETSTDANAGSILLEAPIIELTKGAKINSSTQGSGNGGDLKIYASDYLSLAGVNISGDNAELSANSELESAGKSGNITIEVGDVRSDGGVISTNTEGTRAGGNITVTATGNVELKNSSRISSSSRQSGDAGQIMVNVAGRVLVRDSTIATESTQSGGGNISINSEELIYADNSTITTNVVSGIGNGGNISMSSDFVILSDSNLLAKADTGKGGEITIQANNYYATQATLIDASAGPAGIDGIVDINAFYTELDNKLTPLVTNIENINSLIRPHCSIVPNEAEKSSSSLKVVNYSGFPVSPESQLLGWYSMNIDSGLKNQVVLVAMKSAQDAIRYGNYRRAKKYLQQAVAESLQDESFVTMQQSLRALAQVQHSMGDYSLSIETSDKLLAQKNGLDGVDWTASILDILGSAYAALGQYTEAEDKLTKALRYAKKSQNADNIAIVLNNLGNLHSARQKPERAIAEYQSSAEYSRTTNNIIQEANALANKARVILITKDTSDEIEDVLHSAAKIMFNVEASRDKNYTLLHIAKSYQGLASTSIKHRQESLLRSIAILNEVMKSSRKIGDYNSLTYALGNAASLYMDEHRTEEALYLTRQAIIAAKDIKLPQALYRWHWQEGQLLWLRGHASGAVNAHRRAVSILEQSRQQFLMRYDTTLEYFDKTIAPIYRDLVDVLLQSSGLAIDQAKSESLLIEARAAIEQFKAAELRDYFRNECIAEFEAKTARLESISKTAAIIYPVLLPQRLVLLVSLPDGIKQFNVDVTAAELTQLVRRFRYQLEGISKNQQHKALGEYLYRWLVKPYYPALLENNIKTLVFVPDGPLRTIPFAALFDGENYLVQQFSVATSLGLSLIDPKPIDMRNASVLLAGVSDSTQGFSALPTVTQELMSISQLFSSDVLLNEDFTLKEFRSALETPKTIVHIASHAKFLPSVENSFLLTFDDRLSMQTLNNYLGKGKYRQQALELLFLSACQTAANDDRAALGLAGAGIKAGARSAIGSLWDISDRGATTLVIEFYRQLKIHNLSKARALQAAQLSLLNNPKYSHPFYWASFLLINNWL